jgi:hypothetical protein
VFIIALENFIKKEVPIESLRRGNVITGSLPNLEKQIQIRTFLARIFLLTLVGRGTPDANYIDFPGLSRKKQLSSLMKT